MTKNVRKYSNHIGRQFAEVQVDTRLVTICTRGGRQQLQTNDFGDVYPLGETRAAFIKAKAEEKASA